MIELADISKRKGPELLSGVSFCVPEGGITGLIGPVGSGGSEILKIICGIETAEEGTVRFGGSLTGSRKKGRGAVFYMPLDFMIDPEWRVSEFIRFVHRLTGRSRDELAVRLEVPYWPDGPVRGLSASKHRFLNLYFSLCATSTLILLDDPFAGLTPTEAAEAADILRHERDEGVTAVIALPGPHDVARTCDYAVFLSRGRVLACGSIPDLAEKFDVCDADLESMYLKALMR